jgi:hypothetical protein
MNKIYIYVYIYIYMYIYIHGSTKMHPGAFYVWNAQT